MSVLCSRIRPALLVKSGLNNPGAVVADSFRPQDVAFRDVRLMLPESPEQRELQAKLEILRGLEDRLVSRELELATLREELAAFERRYMRYVGARLAELDGIRAAISEILASRHPDKKELREEAKRAREQATESSAAASDSLAAFDPATERFSPSPEIKKLFWEIAKKIHPDLAANDEERRLRTGLMAKLNDAYSKRDESAMRAVLEEWQSQPEAVAGDGIGQELIRTIRKISRAEGRLRALDEQESRLKASDFFVLSEKVLAAEKVGRDLLGEMARQVERQVQAESERLRGLEIRQSPSGP